MLEIKNKVKLEFHNWTETFSALNDLERKCRVLSYGTSECAGHLVVLPAPKFSCFKFQECSFSSILSAHTAEKHSHVLCKSEARKQTEKNFEA